MEVTRREVPSGRRAWLRWMSIGLVAMLLAVGAAACGDDDETTSGNSQQENGNAEAEAPGEPYEVKGSDPKLPPLVLQGWVPGGKASEEYNIAYVGNTPLNTYVQAMEYGAETAGKSLGVKVDKIIAEWDSAQQINQLQTLLQQNQYDGVVTFLADPNAECRMVSETLPDADIPVVITNFPACGDRDHTEGTIGVSTSQSYAFYKSYAEWAFGWLSKNGGGKVGILSGPAVFGHAKELKKATQDVVKQYDNVEIAQNLTADWTIEGGLSQGETLLQTHPDIKMFLSSYDQNTIGLVKALEGANKKPGEIPIFTLGGDKVTLPMMDEGWIEGIQYLQPIEEVGQGVEMMVAHLDGAEIPTFNNLGDGSSHPAGTVQITPENKDQFKPQF